MGKFIVRIFAVFLMSMYLSGQAQQNMFGPLHTQLLDDYLLFIDSVEKKMPVHSYFEILRRRHVSFLEFADDDYMYKIVKKVKVYRNGGRYEKIDWMIRKHHHFFYHPVFVVKQVGHNYRFIKHNEYDLSSKKMTQLKETTSIDDNYLRVHDVKTHTTYLYVKPMSSLPLLHQE